MTSSRPSQKPAGPNPKVLAVIGGVVALLVVIGIAIAVSGGDDGDDTASGSGSGPAAAEGDVGSGSASGEALTFAPVAVTGDALASFESGSDDAVGEPAPVLAGKALDGSDLTVEAGEPTLLVFLAHWCPHCQAEVPVLVELAEDGAFDGIRLVAVATGTNDQAPNFPPASWLEREEWPGEVLVDDESGSAGAAYGLTSYPFLVSVDADGNVAARASGELPPDGVRELVEAAGG